MFKGAINEKQDMCEKNKLYLRFEGLNSNQHKAQKQSKQTWSLKGLIKISNLIC